MNSQLVNHELIHSTYTITMLLNLTGYTIKTSFKFSKVT
jgi:hypothetical protein